jgi:hypothetical protein
MSEVDLFLVATKMHSLPPQAVCWYYTDRFLVRVLILFSKRELDLSNVVVIKITTT